MSNLEELEATHGFTFGLPDDAPAEAPGPVMKHLVCEELGCSRARGGEHETPIPVHEDTLLPIICGGCGNVLHCDHRAGQPVETVVGTISNPTLMVTTTCTSCGSTLNEEAHALRTVNLEDLPAAQAQSMGAQFERED